MNCTAVNDQFCLDPHPLPDIYHCNILCIRAIIGHDYHGEDDLAMNSVISIRRQTCFRISKDK